MAPDNGFMARFFLGLDAGTQGLTAVMIDLDRGRVTARVALPFSTLPAWGAPLGFLNHADPAIRHAPPLLWVEALDRLLGRLAAAGAPLGRVLAVSGSGQQHGSVYLAPGFGERLAGLDPAVSPAEQLRGIFTRETAPIWMDSSTGAECAEIAAAMGGAERVTEITGSPPVERFTGPQVRAFWKRDPEGYRRTARVHLVSSFLASLLGGTDAPLDPGDGSGTNLMDLRRSEWHPGCVAATAPALAEKLPGLAPSWTVIGPVSPFWTRRHPLAPGALQAAWSGDNPCSLVGLGMVEPNQAGISLGTSDTCFYTLPRLPAGTGGAGHLFGHPAGGWFRLVCFRNGSLARERMRDRFGLDWEGFARLLAASPPGNRGGLLLPWFEPETVPRVAAAGSHRRAIADTDAAGHVRGVVEGQMLAMRLHAGWADSPPTSIRVTGGGSVNDALLQVMADVHQCEVHRSGISDGAALGAALRAAQAWLAQRGPVDWQELVAPFTAPHPEAFRPAPGSGPLYERKLREYREFEAEALAATL